MDDHVFQPVYCIIQTMANKDKLFKGIFQYKNIGTYMKKKNIHTDFSGLTIPFQKQNKKEK